MTKDMQWWTPAVSPRRRQAKSRYVLTSWFQISCTRSISPFYCASFCLSFRQSFYPSCIILVITVCDKGGPHWFYDFRNHHPVCIFSLLCPFGIFLCAFFLFPHPSGGWSWTGTIFTAPKITLISLKKGKKDQTHLKNGFLTQVHIVLLFRS